MTKIGIISDTHDNYTGIKKAVEVFKEKKVDFIVHTGDLVAPPMLKIFGGIKTKFCLGNNEAEIFGLLKMSEKFGVEFNRTVIELEADGKKLIGYHGTSKELLDALIKSGKYDYVLTGHTHAKYDKKEGNVRVINPGSLFLGGDEHTVAVLDVGKDELEFIDIK